MAFVKTYSSYDIPDLDKTMKHLVADSTGRQEATIFSKVEILQGFKFGVYDKGIFVEIGFVGNADKYRTEKTVEFIVNKLYQLYNISKLQVYVIFTEVDRANVTIANNSM